MADRKRQKNSLHDKKRNARLNQLRAEKVLQTLGVTIQGYKINSNNALYAPLNKEVIRYWLKLIIMR